MSYEAMLRELGLFGEEAEGRPPCSLPLPQRRLRQRGHQSLFSSDGIQENGLELCQRRFRLGVGEKFLHGDGGQAPNGLPR